MSSHRFGVCARRVPRLTESHLRPLISTAFTSPPSRASPQNQGQHRTYAVVNAKRLRPLHDVWGEIPPIPHELVARWLDATRQMEKKENKRKIWLRCSDPEYFAALEQFQNVAPQSGADWASKLPTDSRPTVECLNDIGSIISRYTPQTVNIQGRVRLATVMQLAMFSGAAHLGCETSTLSMCRWIAMASIHDKDIFKRPLFRPTMDLHRQMLESNLPMALYIEGELLLRTGKIDAAIRILSRVYDEADSSMVWWPEILNTLGDAHQAKNNTEVALNFWKEAARGGSVDALRGIFRHTSNEELRDDAMYKLACKGDTDVLGMIATLERGRFYENESAPEPERTFQQKLAQEWEKMAEYDMRARGVVRSEEEDSATDGVEVEVSEETLRKIRDETLRAARERQQRSER